MDDSALAKQMADLDAQIRALADDTSSENDELLEQKDAVRAEEAEHPVGADTERSDADLLSELSGLRSQLDRMEAQLIELVMRAGGGAPGMDKMGNPGSSSLDTRMMEPGGASRIQGRIGVIKDILTDRGVDVPDPS
jgi:hypothetical protein